MGPRWLEHKHYFTLKLPFGFCLTFSRFRSGDVFKAKGSSGTWHDVKLNFGRKQQPNQPSEEG